MRALLHAAPNFQCDTCERSFPTLQQVEDHMDSKDHWVFSDETESIEDDDDDSHVCGTCGRWFGSFESREQHMKALNHEPPDFECDTCGHFFQTQRQVEDHMDAKGHWDDYEEVDESNKAEAYPCRLFLCSGILNSEEDRVKHEANLHDYCGDCRRFFSNSNDAWMVSEDFLARRSIPKLTV